MILIEWTMNTTLHRISQEGVALTNWWAPLVAAFDSPQWNLATPYGGQVRLAFGSITLSPDLFGAADWPPPAVCDLVVKYTATTEAAAETLFSGKAHLLALDQSSITYDLFETAYTATQASGTTYNATLTTVFATLAASLGVSLDTTLARSPSPAVNYTTTALARTIDIANDLAAFYTHLFYISGSTLYLVDMAADNGAETLTEFDFFSTSGTRFDVPVNIAMTTNFARTSAYPYGSTLSLTEYHPTAANVNTELDNIIEISNQPKTTLDMPLVGGLPLPGKKLSWTDDSLTHSTAMVIRARSIRFDFSADSVQITGEGSMT